MNKLHYTIQSLAVITFALILTVTTQAQSYRTWVSGGGDDNNPCSRANPCKTFAGAISKTNVNGEINCINPAGYGTLSINKSLTIDCRSNRGSILASGIAIVINITQTATYDPLATVRLRGLEINGTGPCGPNCGTRSGLRGIHVNNSNTRQIKLFVEELFIHGFTGEGIFFNGPGGDLRVTNSSILDNGAAGIRSSSTMAGQTGIVHVTIDNTHTDLNSQGVSLQGNSYGVVKDSTASSNTFYGYNVAGGNLGGAELTLMDSTANNNSYGVITSSPSLPAVVRIVGFTSINNSSSQLTMLSGGTICTNQKNNIGAPSDAPSPCFLDQ